MHVVGNFLISHEMHLPLVSHQFHQAAFQLNLVQLSILLLLLFFPDAVVGLVGVHSDDEPRVNNTCKLC